MNSRWQLQLFLLLIGVSNLMVACGARQPQQGSPKDDLAAAVLNNVFVAAADILTAGRSVYRQAPGDDLNCARDAADSIKTEFLSNQTAQLNLTASDGAGDFLLKIKEESDWGTTPVDCDQFILGLWRIPVDQQWIATMAWESVLRRQIYLADHENDGNTAYYSDLEQKGSRLVSFHGAHDHGEIPATIYQAGRGSISLPDRTLGFGGFKREEWLKVGFEMTTTNPFVLKIIQSGSPSVDYHLTNGSLVVHLEDGSEITMSFVDVSFSADYGCKPVSGTVMAKASGVLQGQYQMDFGSAQQEIAPLAWDGDQNLMFLADGCSLQVY